HIKLRYALVGGAAAAFLWEIVRRVLLWYFFNLSYVNLIYGSLTTVVVALLTLEVAAIILLIGAQCIAEYERMVRKKEGSPPI
ncbi:MAG: YhjD/YihY/BrkB family envelope integrity protein, partial [bacterium]